MWLIRGAVGAMPEQQRVLVLVALGLHEGAHVERLVGDPEAQAFGVERDRLAPAGGRDEERDVADAVGMGATEALSGSFQRPSARSS